MSNEPLNQRGSMVNKAQSLNDEKSIYLQIAERIENDILRDIILEEEKVLSTNEFARMLAINPATAAKGINTLVDQGILYKKRGIGMFVATGAKEMILNRRRGEFLESYVSNLLKEAERLGISKEEIIALIQKSDEI